MEGSLAAAAFDTDKKFRSDFKSERERILSLDREAKALDTSLLAMIERLKVDMTRVRGAGGLMVRLTEQLLSNRNLRLQLVKELRSTKRDVIDREIRLAQLQQEAGIAEASIGATADLLKLLQDRLLTPTTGADVVTLEPGDYDEISADEMIRLRLDGPDALPEHTVPTEVNEGDTVCDAKGQLWILGPEGLEAAGLEAEELILDPPEGTLPYARLSDGSLVLVVEVSD
jgi:hypothetical protein